MCLKYLSTHLLSVLLLHRVVTGGTAAIIATVAEASLAVLTGAVALEAHTVVMTMALAAIMATSVVVKDRAAIIARPAVEDTAAVQVGSLAIPYSCLSVQKHAGQTDCYSNTNSS